MAELKAMLDLNSSVAGRARELHDEHRRQIYVQTDRLFAILMAVQWLAAIAAAIWISPRTWAGRASDVHVHVWAAIFLGGLICGFPALLGLARPGAKSTRYVIASAQMLFSALLIHLSGGRIETHFHAFGSLAFVALYRDWKALIYATIVVSADHIIRGIYYPESVFGVLVTSHWRWVEHTGWVAFEGIILVKSCLRGQREMGEIAVRQAQLEAVNQDIERQVKERSAALAEREARLNAVVCAAHESIVIGDAAGRILAFNPAAERAFGWDAQHAIGRPLSILLPERGRGAPWEDMKRSLSGEDEPMTGGTQELVGLRKDGDEFPFDLSLSSWAVDGRTYFTAIIRDITERKRVEMELLEAKEGAEAASRTKSEFLANMSHEIRTPMNGIIGMTELALGTDLTPEQSECLNTVKYSADSLLVIINDILDFSKIEAGKFILDPVDFDLRTRVGQSLKTLAVHADEKGLELAYEVSDAVPVRLVGDAVRLNQVVMNLAGNALKFTEKGEVVVRVTLDSKDDAGATLHFAISDTGVGIEEEKLATIFEAFHQADASTTRKFGGTGLGLSISRALVERMNGRLWVESQLGVGTTFHFTAHLGQSREAGPLPHPSALRGLRALIVDDNRTNREIQVRALRPWGVLATAADGAAAAFEALRRARHGGLPFHLLLTDCHMPGEDGFSLIERIKAAEDYKDLAIAMLTSGGRPEDVARCKQLGIEGYLLKPVLQADLRDALLRMVGSSALQQISPARPRPETVRGSPPLRMLLAEDNAVNQRVAKRLLERRGHTVEVVPDGAQAVKILAEREFDLVLMDVQMPVMDGMEATAAIRRAEKDTGAHIPIIAITAFAMHGDRERFLACGMDRYVSKPLDFQELLRVIDEVLPPDLRATTQGLPKTDLAAPRA